MNPGHQEIYAVTARDEIDGNGKQREQTSDNGKRLRKEEVVYTTYKFIMRYYFCFNM